MATAKAEKKAAKPDYIAIGDGFIDVTLAKGFMIAGASVMVARMREPTVGDQKKLAKMKGDDVENESAFIADLIMVSPADMDRLTIRDNQRLSTAFQYFLD